MPPHDSFALLRADVPLAERFVRTVGRAEPDFEPTLPAWALNAPIPDEVVSEIKNSPSLGVFNVGQSEVFAGRILKCETLVLHPNARLVMTSLDSAVGETNKTWCAIVARQYKFLAPDTRAIIQRDAGLLAPSGPDGANGVAGHTPGAHGLPGTPGGPGQKRPLRELYLLGERIVNEPGNPMTYIRLQLNIIGIRGGDGGRGGNGGDGARGSRGRDGAAKLGRCRHGCGNGGRGGDGAPGMSGGASGDGSDGADLVFGGPIDFLDLITFSEVNNGGGTPGTPGRRGKGGLEGPGGDRGSHHRFCKDSCRSGPQGSRGTDGNPGAQGVAGEKGLVSTSLLTDLNSFY